MHKFAKRVPIILALLLLIAGGGYWWHLESIPDTPTVTVIDRTLVENPPRLGINVGRSAYYGDQQVSSTLLPHGGFAKGQQTLLIRVKGGSTRTVTDSFSRPDKPNRNYHDSFAGGTYTVMSGPRAGETGKIEGHNANSSTFTLAHDGEPFESDDVIIFKSPYVSHARPEEGKGDIRIGLGEFHPIRRDGVQLDFVDAEDDPADQYLRVEFENRTGETSGGLKHYFTATAETEYVANVRARSDDEGATLSLSIRNLGIKHKEPGYEIELICDSSPELTTEWRTYTFRGTTDLNPEINTKYSTFRVGAKRKPSSTNSTVYIDFVELHDQRKVSPTGFNPAVVNALKEAQCGVLRFYGLANNGSTVDAITAASPTFSPWNYLSYRDHYSMQSVHAVLDDWMKLSVDVNSQPWISVGGANTPDDWYNLISYLAAPADADAYAAKRSRNGRETPWLDAFDVIYLEIGNEWWNNIFRPYHIWTPENYGELCNTIIAKIKTHPNYDPARIKIIAGGWAANARDWNGRLDATIDGHDIISIAPYILHRLDQHETDQDKYGALFADTEGYWKRAGKKNMKQLKKNRNNTRFAVYELNMHLTEGAAPASVASEICVSQASGVAVLDQAMTLLRDMQAHPIAYFTLLKRAEGKGEERRLGLWGNLLREDDGSVRPRPVWQGLRLANHHLIEGDMIDARMAGSPAWKQPENGSIPAMRKVPYLHSYAFRSTDASTGKRTVNLLIVNRHLTDELPVIINLPFEPSPSVQVALLTSDHLTDHNEDQEDVSLDIHTDEQFHQGKTVTVPQHSAVVYQIHEK